MFIGDIEALGMSIFRFHEYSRNYKYFEEFLSNFSSNFIDTMTKSRDLCDIDQRVLKFGSSTM